jgi:hypothetical protein
MFKLGQHAKTRKSIVRGSYLMCSARACAKITPRRECYRIGEIRHSGFLPVSVLVRSGRLIMVNDVAIVLRYGDEPEGDRNVYTSRALAGPIRG